MNENVGKIYTTNEGYQVEIIDYIDRHKVLVKFLEENDLMVWSTMQNIKNGQLKNPYKRTIYGVGYYGVGKHKARINNIKTKQYIKWFSMFQRCYNEKYHDTQKTYIGCCVSEHFFNFQNFAEWYDTKIYDCPYELELDKDLLVKGNKLYSPSTCCFIPKEINSTINSKRHDVVVMKYLYDKYKKVVPSYIKNKLYNLSKGEE